MSATRRSPVGRAELELLELGQVIVESEDLAFELLARTERYRVTGRVEPIGERFRVTVHPVNARPLRLNVGVPAVKAIARLAQRPSALLERLP